MYFRQFGSKQISWETQCLLFAEMDCHWTDLLRGPFRQESTTSGDIEDKSSESIRQQNNVIREVVMWWLRKNSMKHLLSIEHIKRGKHQFACACTDTVLSVLLLHPLSVSLNQEKRIRSIADKDANRQQRARCRERKRGRFGKGHRSVTCMGGSLLFSTKLLLWPSVQLYHGDAEKTCK